MLKVNATVSYPDTSFEATYLASDEIIRITRERLGKDTSLERIANYIAFKIFVGDEADIIQISNVRFVEV